jgi:hypothetical protein
MNYVVGKDDTLERIAASHDCTVGELVKLNRMASRMVGFFFGGDLGLHSVLLFSQVVVNLFLRSLVQLL